MKLIGKMRRSPAVRVWLAVFVTLLAVNFAPLHAGQPSVQLLGEGKWPGWRRGEARSVAVAGNYAYVALDTAGLAVFEVSNPTNCVRVGSDDANGIAYGVAVSGNRAYVADFIRGLVVLDVSDPVHPVRLGGYGAVQSAFAVSVSGNYAYVADYVAGLQVIDVSNPSNCVRVGGYTVGNLFGLAVSGHYAYLIGNGVHPHEKGSRPRSVAEIAGGLPARRYFGGRPNTPIV